MHESYEIARQRVEINADFARRDREPRSPSCARRGVSHAYVSPAREAAFAMRSNIFATVYGSTREDVAAMLGERGWLTRRAGREEIEARDSVSELWIDSLDPVLVHGVSDDPDTTSCALIQIFRGEQMRFTVETYDQSGQLIAKTRSE